MVNYFMMDSLWSELIWLVDWWAGVEVSLFFHFANMLKFAYPWISFNIFVVLLFNFGRQYCCYHRCGCTVRQSWEVLGEWFSFLFH